MFPFDDVIMQSECFEFVKNIRGSLKNRLEHLEGSQNVMKSLECNSNLKEFTRNSHSDSILVNFVFSACDGVFIFVFFYYKPVHVDTRLTKLDTWDVNINTATGRTGYLFSKHFYPTLSLFHIQCNHSFLQMPRYSLLPSLSSVHTW